MTARTVPALLAGLCLLAAASAAGQRLRADFVEPAIPKLAPGQTVTPAVLIHNDSSQSVEFPAVLRVWKADELIYFDSLLIRLLVGDSTYVWFDELACSETLFTGYLFEFYACDADSFERIGFRYCMTTTDTFYSHAGARSPTIDGYLEPGEWNYAYLADVSNLCGWSDSTVWPAGSAFSMFRHDNGYLYVAAELPPAPTRDIGDQIALYIDEDNDGLWAPDSSEGNYLCLVNSSGGTDVQYRPWSPGGPGLPGVAHGSECAFGIQNGHLVFESRFPFGTQRHELTVNNPAADTLGLYLQALDVESGEDRIPGWWPMMLDDSAGWKSPSLYGRLILRTLQSGDIGIDRMLSMPRDTIDTLTIWHPSAIFRNYGTVPESVGAALVFTNTGGIEYADSQALQLAGGASTQLTFPAVRFTVPGRHHGHLAIVAGDSIDWDFWVDPSLGVGEAEPGARLSGRAASTVVRGLLFLPRDMTELAGNSDRVPRPRVILLDISGRKVIDLSPGPNDVGRLAPGIYFVRLQAGDAVRTAKLVIER